MKLELKDVVDTRLLAVFLGIEYKQLTYILYAKRVESFYYQFSIPKKSGKLRYINAPKEPLKNVQRILAEKLTLEHEKTYLKGNTIVHGFTKKRNIITNSNMHRNKQFVINIDLENFFDSIHFGRVKGYFQKNKSFMLKEEVASCIANLTCYNGKLPQGAPSSPVITNFICAILDRRIASIAKKFGLTYTRYADDMTFSTNKKDFLDKKDSFLSEIYAVIKKSGFKVNPTKTRISFWNSRQEVTGIIVNNRINVRREYYKETRSMLNHLYRGIAVECNGKKMSLNQLEGRLAFINQIDWYNNKIEHNNKNCRIGFNARERQYQQFLFYKHFISLNKPVIVTEGKTDVLYIRAALKKLYDKYPMLVNKNENGQFEYFVSFFNKTKKTKFFLGIQQDGADTMKNIYNLYTGKNSFPNLFESLFKYGVKPSNPVILLFDNESKSKKPLAAFLKYTDVAIEDSLSANVLENLYVLTVPLVKGKQECEIEDLLPDEILEQEIEGRRLDRKGNGGKEYYNKQTLALYVADNINNIDFSGFIPLLDEISTVVSMFGLR